MCLESIEQVAIEAPSRKFIISDNESYSYLEVQQFLNETSERLAKLSHPESVVMIKDQRPIYQLLYFLASWKAGLVSIILPPKLSDKRYHRFTTQIQPGMMIEEGHFNNNQVGVSFKENYKGKHNLFLGALSSGTTGEEKIIWRSYLTWEKAFPYQSELFQIEKGNRLLLHGNFNYTANLNSALHILYEKGTIVHTKQKRPIEILNIIRKQKIDAIFMVPTLYRILVAGNTAKFSNVNSVVSAGSKMDHNTFEKLRELFPHAKIVEYYGASELGHVSYLTYEDFQNKKMSVGKAFPEVKILIKDHKIWVNSPYIADEFSSPYSAGDLGSIDEEGFLYIKGREGNIINKAGEKIIAEEIEEVLMGHPSVKEAVVIGKPHKIKGQEIMAFVATKIECSNINLKKDLKNYCKQFLEATKIPKTIKLIESIPKNSNGKYDRQKLMSLI